MVVMLPSAPGCQAVPVSKEVTLRSSLLRQAIAKRTGSLVISVGLAFPLGLALLAMPPIGTRGESREAMVVRSVTRGDWILPLREGRVPSKPPLFHWIAAVPASAFGTSDVTLRLPSTIAAWLMLLTTIALGLDMGGRRVGWLSSIVLLCMPDFWRAALEARVDMVFATCVCLSLAGGHRWIVHGAARGLLQCWLAGAAAVLAKGPAGAVLPAVILWTWTTSRSSKPASRSLWSMPLAAGAACIVLGWYAAAYHIGGQAFIDVQVLRENVDRALGLHGFAHRRQRDLLKLPGAFLVHLAPWNLAIVESGMRWYRGHRLTSDTVFLHFWWIVVLGAFTLAAGQRSIYLLPLHPAVALLCGCVLAVRVTSRWLFALSVALCACAVGVATLTVRGAWRDAEASQALREFGQRIKPLIASSDGVQASWGLSENDRLVLAYLLDRDVPRIDTPAPETTYVIAAIPVGQKLRRTCIPVVPGSSARHPTLALLKCTTSEPTN